MEDRICTEVWLVSDASPHSRLMLWSGTAMRLGLVSGDRVRIRYDKGMSSFASMVEVSDTIEFEHVRIEGAMWARVDMGNAERV